MYSFYEGIDIQRYSTDYDEAIVMIASEQFLRFKMIQTRCFFTTPTAPVYRFDEFDEIFSDARNKNRANNTATYWYKWSTFDQQLFDMPIRNNEEIYWSKL